MLCVMTEFTTSSNVWSSIGTEQSLHHTFPSNILTLAMTCTGFSKCGNSSILLSLSHLPFLLLTCGGLIATTASKPRLLSSFFPPPLVWFLSPQAGICVMSVDSPQSPEESIDAKHSSICQSKRTQSVLKKTSGHEAQWDINNPCFQKIKIRKSLHWNIKWHWVEYSMLVTSDSFNDFFCNFVLCDKKGTSEKKKLSHDDRDIGGIRASCLEKTVWNPRATPPLTCGRNHPH